MTFKLIFCFVLQTSFSNNPITGLILMIGLIIVGPGTFICCSVTSLLGHLISIVSCSSIFIQLQLFLIGQSLNVEQSLQEPQVNVDNGLTVFNPLIFGAVSYYFVPIVYGEFDGFSCSLMLLCVIFMWDYCPFRSIVALINNCFSTCQCIHLESLQQRQYTMFNHAVQPGWTDFAFHAEERAWQSVAVSWLHVDGELRFYVYENKHL